MISVVFTFRLASASFVWFVSCFFFFLMRLKLQSLKTNRLCVATSFQCFVFTDEKERFDPTQFQDCIIQGLTETGTDLEAVAKFLDASGAKLDYRRYAETLFDILVAGGMLGKSL